METKKIIKGEIIRKKRGRKGQKVDGKDEEGERKR